MILKRLGLLLAPLLMVGMMLFSASSAFAAEEVEPFCETTEGSETEFCKNKNDGTDPITGEEGLLSKILNVMALAMGVTSVIVIIIAGFNLVFSSGNPESVARGRNMITFATIGLAIAISAKAFVAFVLYRIGI